MKKTITLVLALIVVLSFAACGNVNEKPSGDTSKPSNTQSSEAAGTQENNNNNKNNDDGSGSQAAMEVEILKRLSAISSLTSLTLCDGEKITYTEDGIIMAGDTWTIANPTMGKDEFQESVKTQLVAAGFTWEKGWFGDDYLVKAGPGTIGINIMYDEDAKEIMIRTTNLRDQYSAAYIEAENAKLPTIIEYEDIIDKLPENFSISFETNLYRYVVCRYNGGYYVEMEDMDRNGDYSDYRFIHYNAAVPTDDGSYLFYKWQETIKPNGTVDKENMQTMEKFMDSSDAPLDVVKRVMANLSEWGRMSWEYKEMPVDENRFFGGMSEYRINQDVTKNGTETFLGRDCEKVHCEGGWASDGFDIIFDLETGMTMKMTVQPSGSETANPHVEVTEYNINPTSLGKFVQP